MTVLVIAEHDGRALNGATLNAIAAAGELGMPVHVLVAGADAQAAAEAAARAGGVAKVLLAQSPQLADGLAENLASQAVAIPMCSWRPRPRARASRRASPPCWTWPRCPT
jgi:electron transfer flavoprotein alpha subunit